MNFNENHSTSLEAVDRTTRVEIMSNTMKQSE